MLVKITHGGLYSSTGGKTKGAIHKTTIAESKQEKSHKGGRRSSDQARVRRERGKARRGRNSQKEWTQRNDLLPGTSGSQSSGNNWRHDRSFKAAEFRERWRGPGVQLRPASHHAAPVRRERKRERERTKETLTEILAPTRWAEPHNYSSSAAKIN